MSSTYEQRFVLISSLLAIALKQMIFAVLLGIQWFEKQNVRRWKIQIFSVLNISHFLFFFNFGGVVIITLMGQHDKQKQSQKKPQTKHKQHEEEKRLKPVQNQQKSLHNHSTVEGQLYWATLPSCMGNFLIHQTLLHLASLFLLPASPLAGDFVWILSGGFVSSTVIDRCSIFVVEQLCLAWRGIAVLHGELARQPALLSRGAQGIAPLPGSSSGGCDLGKGSPERHSGLEYTIRVVYRSSCVFNIYTEPEIINLNTQLVLNQVI